jgi:hypothetical protein
LRFGLEAGFSEIEDRYVFAGLFNPSDPEAINDWKVSRANPRVKDSEAERNQSADTNTQNASEEVNSTSNGAGNKASDSAIKQKLLGYWLSPRHGYHFTADGIIYMCPRKYGTTTTMRWAVTDGRFYWDGSPHTIVTLNDKKFVYREQEPRNPGGAATFTLLRSTKEKVDPD